MTREEIKKLTLRELREGLLNYIYENNIMIANRFLENFYEYKEHPKDVEYFTKKCYIEIFNNNLNAAILNMLLACNKSLTGYDKNKLDQIIELEMILNIQLNSFNLNEFIVFQNEVEFDRKSPELLSLGYKEVDMHDNLIDIKACYLKKYIRQLVNNNDFEVLQLIAFQHDLCLQFGLIYLLLYPTNLKLFDLNEDQVLSFFKEQFSIEVLPTTLINFQNKKTIRTIGLLFFLQNKLNRDETFNHNMNFLINDKEEMSISELNNDVLNNLLVYQYEKIFKINTKIYEFINEAKYEAPQHLLDELTRELLQIEDKKIESEKGLDLDYLIISFPPNTGIHYGRIFNIAYEEGFLNLEYIRIYFEGITGERLSFKIQITDGEIFLNKYASGNYETGHYLEDTGRRMLSEAEFKRYDEDYLILDHQGNRLFDPVDNYSTALTLCELAVNCGIREGREFKIQNLLGKMIGILFCKNENDVIELKESFSLKNSNYDNWKFKQKLFTYKQHGKYNHSFVAKKKVDNLCQPYHYKVTILNCRKIAYSTGHEKIEFYFIDQFNKKNRAYFEYKILKKEYPNKIDIGKTKIEQKRFSNFIKACGIKNRKNFKLEDLIGLEVGLKFVIQIEQNFIIIQDLFSLNNLPNSAKSWEELIKDDEILETENDNFL